MRWRIEQQEDGSWTVVSPDGTVVASVPAAQPVDPPTTARTQAVLALTAAAGDLRALFPLTAAVGDDEAEVAVGQRWESDAAYEGVWTNDGRGLEPGTTTFREAPLPLMLQTVTAYGHDGAELVGYSDRHERIGSGEGAALRMAGVLDASEEGGEALAILEEHGTFGVSIDVGWPEAYESQCIAMDDDGWCERWRDLYVGVPILGLTMTPFPAMASARIWLEGTTPPELAQQDMLFSAAPDAIEPEPTVDELLMLLASAGPPVAPPAAWFGDPVFTAEHPNMQFSEAGCPIGVPMTVTPEGRVFGHIATWNQCHSGYADRCVTAPRDPSGAYAHFRTGAVVTEEGTEVPVGVITMDGGHADLTMNARQAASHYDDSTTAVAQVACGEDEYGIWFSGALLPGVTEDQVRRLRSLAPSGDWRPIGGELNMIAALAVNVPGFPIPRGLGQAPRPLAASAMPASREAGGKVVALVAAGIVPQRPEQHLDPLEALVAAAPALAPIVAAMQQLAAGQDVLLRRTEHLVPVAAEHLRATVAAIEVRA